MWINFQKKIFAGEGKFLINVMSSGGKRQAKTVKAGDTSLSLSFIFIFGGEGVGVGGNIVLWNCFRKPLSHNMRDSHVYGFHMSML